MQLHRVYRNLPQFILLEADTRTIYWSWTLSTTTTSTTAPARPQAPGIEVGGLKHCHHLELTKFSGWLLLVFFFVNSTWLTRLFEFHKTCIPGFLALSFWKTLPLFSQSCWEGGERDFSFPCSPCHWAAVWSEHLLWNPGVIYVWHAQRDKSWTDRSLPSSRASTLHRTGKGGVRQYHCWANCLFSPQAWIWMEIAALCWQDSSKHFTQRIIPNMGVCPPGCISFGPGKWNSSMRKDLPRVFRFKNYQHNTPADFICLLICLCKCCECWGGAAVVGVEDGLGLWSCLSDWRKCESLSRYSPIYTGKSTDCAAEVEEEQSGSRVGEKCRQNDAETALPPFEVLCPLLDGASHLLPGPMAFRSPTTKLGFQKNAWPLVVTPQDGLKFAEGFPGPQTLAPLWWNKKFGLRFQPLWTVGEVFSFFWYVFGKSQYIVIAYSL